MKIIVCDRLYTHWPIPSGAFIVRTPDPHNNARHYGGIYVTGETINMQILPRNWVFVSAE